ncbi:MAG: hypothetical protein PVG16_02595 [Chromatiales bacterium]|jgi:hypothetical protein
MAAISKRHAIDMQPRAMRILVPFLYLFYSACVVIMLTALVYAGRLLVT